MTKSQIKKINILFSIIAGFIIFALSKPAIVNAINWKDIIGDSVFEVDTQIDTNNYRQIILRDDSGSKYFVTNDATTHANPSYKGNYITWMAISDKYWQIFVYDIKAKKTFQLTNSQNNVNPKVDGDKIVWEGQKDGIWQIFVYNGLKITQLTADNNPKQDIDVNSGYITFSQKNINTNIWEIFLYDNNTKTMEKISSDESVRFPKLNNNKIIWKSFEDNSEIINEYDILSKKYEKTTVFDNTIDKINVINNNEELKPEIPLVEEQDIINELENIEEINDNAKSTPSSDEMPAVDIKESSQSTASER